MGGWRRVEGAAHGFITTERGFFGAVVIGGRLLRSFCHVT